MKEIFNYIALRKKYNTLKLKHEILEERIKNDLFKNVNKSLNNDFETKKLRERNKKLRDEVKSLKRELIEKEEKK